MTIDTSAALEAENRRLKDRIAVLEDALGFTVVTPLAWMLTRTEMTLFGLLYRRASCVSREVAMTVLYGDRNAPPDDKIVDIVILKLRRKLKPFGMAIETRHGIGWELPPETRHVARRQMEGTRS